MERRGAVLGLAGAGALAIVGGGFFLVNGFGGKPATTGTPAAAPAAPSTGGALAYGDSAAIKKVCEGLVPKEGETPTALTEAQGKASLETLNQLRAGFLKMKPADRGLAAMAAGRIVDRFRIEPTPPSWKEALIPARDVLVAAMADGDAEVRAAGLLEVGKLWSWLPGLTMTPLEERQLADWKDGFVDHVTRHLGDTEVKSRAAAITCVAASPLPGLANQAAVNIDHSQAAIRYATLMAFAQKPAALSNDDVTRRLHDEEPSIAELAAFILKSRGLSQEQVGLARLITHTKADLRASVIPLVKDREDIDPEVWLLQLTHDNVEFVRVKAVEALKGRTSPDVERRLRELAAKDTSADVRKLAGQILSALGAETTAALPPLPGSPSLNPKAN